MKIQFNLCIHKSICIILIICHLFVPTITDMIAKTLTTILEVQETFRAKCDKDRVGILYFTKNYKKQ